MIKEDLWGNKTILVLIKEGGVFGETFACGSDMVSTVTFVTASECKVLFMPFDRILHSCNLSCVFHHRLIENMVRLIADKNVQFLERLEVASKRTLREKILSFLSAQAEFHDNREFVISMGRLELADYLCVDRSALTRELSNMEADGLIEYEKTDLKFCSKGPLCCQCNIRSLFVKIQTKHKEENVCTEKKSSQLEMLQKRKIEFLKKSPLGYLLASVLAGMFIGFGILLIFTIGGLLDGAPYTKSSWASPLASPSAWSLSQEQSFLRKQSGHDNRYLRKTGENRRSGQAVDCVLGQQLSRFHHTGFAIHWRGLRRRTGGAVYRWRRTSEDDAAGTAAFLAGRALQHFGLPGGVVRLPLQDGERKIDHDFLVSLCIYHLWF